MLALSAQTPCQVAEFLEAQAELLSTIFPYHVLEYLATLGGPGREGSLDNIARLARHHDGATILFM